MKKIFKLLLCVIILATSIFTSQAVANFTTQITTTNTTNYVTFVVEANTLGGGLIRQPIRVPIIKGDNFATITDRALGGSSNYTSTGTFEENFYLSGIKIQTPFTTNVDQIIQTNLGMTNQDFLNIGRANHDLLLEFDYSPMSGWMYRINNSQPDVGASAKVPQAGDVIRWQFTLALGADLGGGWDAAYFEAANKDGLLTAVAKINSAPDSANILAQTGVQAAMDGAFAVLTNLTATQPEVDEALHKLHLAVNTPPNPDQNPNPEPEEQTPELAPDPEPDVELEPTFPEWVIIHSPANAQDALAQIDEILINDFGQSAEELDYAVVERLRVTGTLSNIFNHNSLRQPLQNYLQELDLSWIVSGSSSINAYSQLQELTLPGSVQSGIQGAIQNIGQNPNLEKVAWTGQVDALATVLMFNNTPALQTMIFYGEVAPTISANVFAGRPATGLIAYVPNPTQHGYQLENFTTNFQEVRALADREGETSAENVDKEALSTVITKANNLNEADYTVATWQRLQTELTIAQTVAKNSTSTQNEVDRATFRTQFMIADLMLVGMDATFFRVPKAATFGVYRKSDRHFAPFQNIELTLRPELAEAEFNIFSADLPLGVGFHLEAYIKGETAKTAKRFSVAQLSQTIDVELIPLNEWQVVDNGWQNANMYTNLDDSGTLNLSVGETFDLDTFRVWQAMHGFTENYFIEPVFNFEVFGDDNLSTQRIGETGRKQLRITADKPGVAVIKITYDPLRYIHTNGQILDFNAIDAHNTMAVVVNVTGGQDFNTGITMRNDFDTFYFDRANGSGEFSFAPAPGSAVRVHQPLSLSSWGNGWATYQADAAGEFSVNLHDGRNIVEIRNGESVRYHLIEARGIEVVVENITNPDADFSEGDTARISLRGMRTPVEKLAGVYNPGFGTALRPYISYSNTVDFITSPPGGQYSTLTDSFTIDYILEDAQLNVLNGTINIGLMGAPLGTHRNIPITGLPANLTAVAIQPQPFSILPEIVLPLAEADSTRPPSMGMDITSELADTLALLISTTPEPEFSVIGGEWAITALARSGFNVPDGYFDSYLGRITEMVTTSAGILAPNRRTDYSRLVVALNALRQNPQNIGGYDLTARILDVDAVLRQGINGPIWALNALNSTTVPGAAEAKQQYLDFILSQETTNGGWALMGQNPDPDITSMAIYALAMHREKPAIAAAIDRGVDALSRIQSADGSFGSFGATNSQSNAQVIIALTAIGIDPVTDARFVTNGHNPLTALLAFYVEGGGFKHTMTTAINGMATEQGALALVAYQRFLNGQSPLFDMRIPDAEDINLTPETASADLSIWLAQDKVANTASTFNAVIQTSDFPTVDFRVLNGVIEIPAKLTVEEVVTNNLTGGTLMWHYDQTDQVIRFVYTTAELELINFEATNFPADLLTLKLSVNENVTNTEATIAVNNAGLLSTVDEQAFNFNIDQARRTITFLDSEDETDASDGDDNDLDVGIDDDETVIELIGIRELFRGDGTDLIPDHQRAVAIVIDELAEGVKLIYNETTMLYFSPELTARGGVNTYVLLVDIDICDEDLLNPHNYQVVPEQSAQIIRFGDTTGNGIINAQDALNILTSWLRITPTNTHHQILTKNVTATSSINTLDALAVMEHFISGTEFIIVGK